MSAPLSGVILTVLPLALGAAVSPLLMVGEILCLTQPRSGLRQGWLFVAGNALVLLLWLLIALLLGQALPLRQAGSDAISGCLHVALGLVLVTLATQLLLHPAALRGPGSDPALEHRTEESTQRKPLRSFVIGLLMMAENMSTLVLFLPAVTDIARADQPAGIAGLELALVSLITLSPSLAPALLASVGGRRGRRLLDRLDRWLQPRKHLLALGVSLAMGGYMLGSGVMRLLG